MCGNGFPNGAECLSHCILVLQIQPDAADICFVRDGFGVEFEHDRKADLARGSITVWAGSDLRRNAMRSL